MNEKYLFTFKKFKVKHQVNAHKVGTDSMLLGAWTNYSGISTILDIGTGSGLLSLMAAQLTDANTKITALEINDKFCEEAKINFENSPWNNKIELINQDINYYSSCKFDLIICNPPYFENQLLSPKVEKNSARHTVHLSLKRLPEIVSNLLNENGRFNVVLPFSIFDEEMKANFENNQLYVTRICKVKHNPKRDFALVLIEFSREKIENLIIDNLVINQGNKEFSKEYIQLLNKFLIIL